MKTIQHILILLSLLFFTQIIVAQPRMEWTFVEHDYGTMQEGADGLVEFSVKNIGDEDLYITDFESKCGCLQVAGYTQAAIPPQKKGFIHLKYDTNLLGRFTKYAVIYTNAGGRRLKVYGEVIEGF